MFTILIAAERAQSQMTSFLNLVLSLGRMFIILIVLLLGNIIEYEIFGEGSHISTNQKRENSVFSQSK